MTRAGKIALLAQVYRLELLAEQCGAAKAAGIDNPVAQGFREEREAARKKIELALGCGHG